jgi:hypothetical protein
MSAKRISFALIALVAWLTTSGQALATSGVPAWQLTATSLPTNFVPGSEATDYGPMYLLTATNAGAAPTTEPVTLTDIVPAGIVPIGAGFRDNSTPVFHAGPCEISGQEVTCTDSSPIAPGRYVEFLISVRVEPFPSEESLLNEASIEGGGALPISTHTTTTVGSSLPPFDFLPGFSAPFSGEDGAAATQAGSHPYQLSIDMGFPTEKPTKEALGGSGHLHDVIVDLPRGEIVNPNATPVLCTEAQLVTELEEPCPEGSQVGTVTITTVAQTPEVGTAPLYNMVTPPGVASNFGFDAIGVGIFVHILGGVRSDGDYGLSGGSTDLDALPVHPIFGIRVEFWGDPASAAHDAVRGECAFSKAPECPLKERVHKAFLTAPSECTGQPSITRGRASDWEEPSVTRHTSYASADFSGTPVSVNGCNELQFEPSIEAKPTTNLADSPSGLDVKVHQPQNVGVEEVEALSPAILKDIALTLPEGVTVNPSSADGLGACTEAQAHVHSLSPAACPDASKLGTVEVTTPLLDHSLPGVLYLAKPFQNPYGSLISLYLTIHDSETGTVANLAGRVTTDPVTGQLTTRFEENPQLPLEDVKVHLFTGPRAALRTPPACATYTSTAQLRPWSAPETPEVTTTDSFAIQASPSGGNCPTSPASAPNSPSFSAGTVSPQAGAYSPFVLKVKREDATQPLAGIDTTLAPGLIGKLAGISYCPEGQIAQAQGRNKPNEGALEQANSSCPASSEVGSVDVAAGAGITPLHVQGHAYLAGSYKGAPLSLAVITPAVAGPFDLGAVVVRVALHLDPETAVIHAVSDPLPQILDGIPLDVRSVSLEMGKPDFTLNPTNCDPMSIKGTLTSALGQSAALSSPFQVGGCDALAFKPKLAIRLKGATKRTGHPALTAVADFTKGQANTKRVEVTLPRSEFLDQAHIGTVCTRVQFAANQCPAASVYGEATATTPLLAQPLQGPVYLRSSSHELPDLVVALHGQVDVVLDGRVDSVNGGIRSTFEATPDAPVSKFVLKMRGGKKGLLINSANLCKLKPAATRATVKMDGQNGKAWDTNPVVKSSCKKAKGKKAKGKKAKGKKGHRPPADHRSG